jgi:16S rRNA (cytosine967-C5)-methyltransferase
MAESSTLNHAARVLHTITPQLHADVALRRYFTTARHVGPREKRAISNAVFVYFRWIQWLDSRASDQKRIEEALEFQARFDKNPASIKAEALAARAVPEWLRAEATFPLESLRLLQQTPALWIRVRPGRTRGIAATLGHCVPPAPATLKPYGLASETDATGADTAQALSTALRYKGPNDLFLTPQFHGGDFEIQDLASQFVGHACAPKPGETWWDACAGEGGKLLHLADQMGNKGLIWASDRSERRLQSLKRRTARAKVYNYRAAAWDGSAKLPTKTKFDGVLLDAPCSGVGTWQRNPHARWTTGLDDVKELAQVQRQMLEHVAPTLKAGGRLVYAVCTLTRAETTAVASAFTEAHPEFEPVPVFAPAGSTLSSPACDVGATELFSESAVTLWPHQIQANGMFIATWRRK